MNFIILFIFLSLFNFYNAQTNSSNNKNITKIGCKIDKNLADPFDKSLRSMIRTIHPDKCTNNFYYADLDLKTGIIEPNYRAIKEKGCDCNWNLLKIITASVHKNEFLFKKFQNFNSPINMIELRNEHNGDTVLIRCKCGLLKIGKIEKLFSYPNFKLDNRKSKAPIKLDEKLSKVQIDKNGTKKCPIAPNVVVVVIESLSYLNFKRHMRKTADIFNQYFNSTMVEFESVIKLGENSYPNMINLITGIPKKSVKYPHGIVRESYYDDAPLIWKEFEKKRGYYTSFIEDMPTYGLFNWIGKGFKSKNTDYFNRNFYCASGAFNFVNNQMSPNCKPTSDQCLTGRNSLDLQFEQLESFILRMEKEKQNYFTYSDPGYLTHDDFNLQSVMDHHTARFVIRNYETLRNSVFLFLGDHGNRFGPQMKSWVGRIESSWPYLAINVPKSVQEKYPNILPTLKTNSKRLVTWIDVHAALNDLANCDLEMKISNSINLNLKNQIGFEKPTNYSLITELIPNDRTCDDALIPSEYCICLPREKLSINTAEAKRAGQEFINQLNKKLKPYPKCVQLKLSKVTDISKVIKDPKFTTYDLVIEALPSKGIFRGELIKYSDTNWKLSDTYERFNKYGAQGNCIANKVLQKVCYCKNYKRYKG